MRRLDQVEDGALPYAFRAERYSAEKAAIARRAMALLQPGDSVFVDGGTTTWQVARFIPEVTSNTTESCIEIGGARYCDRAIQTNNVNIDDRGYIYAVDRASTGLHVLELTGAAREIAGL